MKKIVTLFAVMMLLFPAMKAQTTLTNAVDFTVTDVNGGSHNLFNILASGKHVCIDFFFTTCGPCQATVPYFAQAYTNYGCNTADIFFMSIDLGNTNAQCLAYETTYIGGPQGFPVVSGTEGGGDAVCNAYGITAYPTYILIAPNHSIIEQDMWPISSAATFDTYFNSHSLSQTPCATGIASENVINASVYPNPATSQLNISSNQEITSYSIFDASGREVKAEALNQHDIRLTVDVMDLSSGMYIVELRSENGTSRVKFNKQ